MGNAIEVSPSAKAVTVVRLTVTNPDFFSVLSGQPESNREQCVKDIIAVGSAAMRRVQTTVDVDFVEKRFEVLSSRFEHALNAFEKQTTNALTRRFSPTESGSYTKHIGELVGEARRDVQGWTTNLSKTAKDLLDPDKKGSAVGQLEKIVELAEEEFAKMFDPEVKGSYSAQLNEQLGTLFGGCNRVGVLQTCLTEAVKPILAELRELKEKVEGRKAAAQIIAASTLKGGPFEELVHVQLAQLAKPFGDDIAAVGSGKGGSKAGDFLIVFNGSGKRVVVEARDRKQMSLPAIKQDLEREMKERDANVSLYVSSCADMLPQHVGDFQIYGEKVVTTLHNLSIAYRVARVMALMQSHGGEIDAAALGAVLCRIKDATHWMRNVKSKATQIENLADGIHEDSRNAETTILGLLSEAEALLVDDRRLN
jgi:hypothetical protein